MLRALTVLVLCQFAGEVIARAAGLPLPAPVVGLILLLLLLFVRRGPDGALRDTSNGLPRHLSLLFVPAGVGIVTQLDALERDWLPILDGDRGVDRRGPGGHRLADAAPGQAGLRGVLLDETAGALGGLAIGLTGIITAILVPFLATLL